MEEMMWVEILSPQGTVLARHRCSGEEIRIGRGYDNDVILDDPYVAPNHLLVHRDEAGMLVASDLGSAGGLYLDRRTDRRQFIALDGDQRLRIGHSYLRIRDAHYPVAPEAMGKRVGKAWWFIAILAVLVVAVAAVEQWLAMMAEVKPAFYLMEFIGAVLIIGVWTGLWALVSRIVLGEARFPRHLCIALAGLLVFSLYLHLIIWGAFAFSLDLLAEESFAGLWVLGAVVCFFHLWETGRSHFWLKGGVLALLAVIAIAAQTLSTSEAGATSGRQNYVRQLMPPAFRLAPLKSDEQFFGDVEGLRLELDRAKAKALATGNNSSPGTEK